MKLAALLIVAISAIMLLGPHSSPAQTSDARSLPNRGAIGVNSDRPSRPTARPASPPSSQFNVPPAQDAVSPVVAQNAPANAAPVAGLPGMNVDELLSPGGLTSSLKIMLVVTVLSLAPSILIMTTCFIRFVIVLGLLRQALGTQQLPPNQVLMSLCLFLTFLIMAPVWREAYEQGVRPYTHPEPGQMRPSLEAACENTVRPLRRFMGEQIEKTDNSDAVWMFLEYQRPAPGTAAANSFHEPQNYDELPLSVLLPAFMVSELKTAFVIGFQIYLPFLVIDMVVAGVLISMGMMMLPPVLISLPFKLLLFILIDGWFLTVGMMLESVRPLT